jgi:hypothetical protein
MKEVDGETTVVVDALRISAGAVLEIARAPGCLQYSTMTASEKRRRRKRAPVRMLDDLIIAFFQVHPK